MYESRLHMYENCRANTLTKVLVDNCERSVLKKKRIIWVILCMLSVYTKPVFVIVYRAQSRYL
jgi:hypothetical protein